MQQSLVQVNLHGVLGETIGRSTYNLAVKTVSGAINAIEILSKRKLFKFLMESEKHGIRYHVLINGRDFLYEKQNPPNPQDPQSIANSELCAKVKDLKTIDIVPVIEGAGKDFLSILTIIVGVVLVIVGIVSGFNVPLIIGGLGLIAAGVINLLARPPELQEFKQRQKTSYLFTGPTNTSVEGGCVPVGYGRLPIGSVVASASYDIGYYDANDNNSIVNQDQIHRPSPSIN